MSGFGLPRRLVAEALGTALLVATVVGSGIMADTLDGDVALALLGNTLPTGAILVVLITILGPMSGAHFNPAVSLAFALRRELPRGRCLSYIAAQIAGGIAGTIAGACDVRPAAAGCLAEGAHRRRPMAGRTRRRLRPARDDLRRLRFNRPAVPWLVGLYITAAYWFTASTSFANPAVTIARALTDTFSGIRPLDLPGFVIAELCGAIAALMLMSWLLRAAGEGAAMMKEAQVMSVTIYHNPACGTSRNTLAMIRQSGEEPEVIEYLKNPPDRARLIELIAAMGISVRALLREKGTPYAELGLADPKWSDDQLIDFMLAHPILINRPIVVTPKGTRLCRPSEAVLDLLDNPATSFVKEDGEIVEAKRTSVGWAKRSVPTVVSRAGRMVGTAQARLDAHA